MMNYSWTSRQSGRQFCLAGSEILWFDSCLAGHTAQMT
jgi:hypothetical protein